MMTITNNTDSTSTSSSWIRVDGTAEYVSCGTSFEVKKGGISANIYFKFVKKKFKLLQTMRLEARLKKLEKAFYLAIENGQDALAEKFLKQVALETKECELYAKGIRFFIEESDLQKHKYKVRGGHISDTRFSDYTRIIPKAVLKKKKEVEEWFDDFVIYHYWSEEAQKDIKSMSKEEKQQMRDPILFGITKESNKLYFIADWEDDYCDLTFTEIVDALDKEEKDITIRAKPIL